jgi:hypothetical protein
MKLLFPHEKRKKKATATIFSEALHSASDNADKRMKSFVELKEEKSETAAAVGVLGDEYYSIQDTNKLLKAYHLVENETKAEIFLCIRRELRDSWLEIEIS